MLLRFVWNNIKAKLLRNILVTVSICVSVTLIMLVLNVGYQINDSFIQGTSQYDLVVGYKGSDTQLVLNSIFYFDTPEGNIPYSAYTKLQGDSRIRRIIPLAMGDNLNGYKIVGTNDEFFTNSKLKDGGFLGVYDEGHPVIVLGYNVAKNLKLSKGSIVTGTHGTHGADDEDEHGHYAFQYTVAGILDRSNTSDDNVAFTHFESVWEAHGYTNEDDNTEGGETKDDHNGLELTAILIQSQSFAASELLRTDINLKSNEYKIVNTDATLRNVLSIFGSAQSAIVAILIIVVIISFNMMFLAMFTAANERQKDFAILRALGSSKNKIFITIILEAVIISTAGVLGGFILSHLGIQIVSNFITGLFGIKLKFYTFYLQELLAAIIAIVLSVAAAIIPATAVYRTEPSKYLN